MMGRYFLIVFILGMAVPAFGGGIDNKQNFSSAYAGSLSRNAATDGADAAAYNPAGLILLKNGTYLELDLLPFTFDYDHEFNGETQTSSPNLIAPMAFGVHKQDKWAVWGSFTINGGGGETEYENGNIITQTVENQLAGGAFSPVLPAGRTLSQTYACAESYDYTFTAGVSYDLHPMVSVAAGLRYVITDKEVDLHGTYSGADIMAKYDQEADGYGGVIGIDIHPSDALNIGIRYESKVKLDWDTETSGSNALGIALLERYGRVDGQSYARDLPALLALGVEWKILPKLTLKPSFSYYFEEDADWDTQNYAVDGNSYELALAIQYDVNDDWSLTAGYLYINVDMKPENFGIIEQMNPPLDCHAFAVGAKYRVTEKVTLILGFSGYFYEDATASADPVTGRPEVTYDKALYQGGFGIQYRF
ncbi:long-chain fatty acid transport protein [Desulfobacter hydrogenophilus]|uniref:Long-chain fatty acid transport protein n=1 Tax=Desulfobacter hydrogenophilus TaxID=2291 RepID=A0A328FE16_9BACT|nr:outer membrane protein transport protein [Desulfobacter hydrogenophilus]NDY71191.1 long-chain fatty acid transport protein [Desulfobacter hydrogenophilus]QBH14210.1 long-chain fatty acid transport protein [Desulfobacter hydrogenophilus]RAM02858.1 long-chain fatty acid transport protein [Desulfobacter hydrogenophilus]